MKIYDVSLTISPEIPVWPGDGGVKMERASKLEEGGHTNSTNIAMGVHTGTHVDAPYHFLRQGKGVDQLDLNALVGPAYVAAFPDSVKRVTADALRQANIPAGVERLLLKTSNSEIWARDEKQFNTSFVGVTEDGAKELVRMGLRLIGIDYLSIAPYKESGPTHEVLLGVEMVIIEGLNLTGIEPGHYDMVALPVKLKGSDGSPCRVILTQP